MHHAAELGLSIRVVLAAFITFAGPFLDLHLARKMRETRASSFRLRFYRYETAFLWAIGVVCFVLIGEHGVLHLPAVVLANPGVLGNLAVRIVLTVLATGFLGIVFWPGAVCVFRELMRPAYTKAVAKQSISFMLPIGTLERRWWVALSIAAGICEEIIFRGFLMTVARGELGMDLLVALLATSAVFGFNHLYQGGRAIVMTALVGLMLGVVSILTAGLLLPMLLHAAMDLQVLAMYRPEGEDAAQ
jgi:membrane protease YdiL (CAAX protease family)